MTYFSHLRAGLISTGLLLTTALASPALAETLPEISPRQIAGDVKVQYNQDTGTREYIAPTFDPFEEDEALAGTANLRSVSNAVTIDGQSVRGGALLDLTFYYSSPTSDPYDIRGYEEGVFLSGEYAPVVMRDNRVLDCSEQVTESIYHHDNYYSPSLYLNFYRPYRHYGGHYRFGHSRFGNRYGHAYRRGFNGYRGIRSTRGSRHDGYRRRRGNRDADTTHRRRRHDDDRVRDRDRRRDEDGTRRRRGDRDGDRRVTRRDREGDLRVTPGTNRRNNGRTDRTDRTPHNSDRTPRTTRRNDGRTGRNIRTDRTPRTDRAARTNDTPRPNRRTVTPDRRDNPRPRLNTSREDRTRPVIGENRRTERRLNNGRRNARPAAAPRPTPQARAPRSVTPRAAAPARSAPAARPTPAPRPAPAARPARPPKVPAASRPARVDRAVDRAFRGKNPSRANRRIRDFFPKASSWSRRAVTNVNTQCAREERLTVHIPQERLDASRFDGLTVLVLDRAGREIPVYIPPNYVEGFRQAVSGQVTTISPPRYDGPTYNEPAYREPNPSIPIETAPCPTGTLKQPDGTCLTTGTTYGGYPRP